MISKEQVEKIEKIKKEISVLKKDSLALEKQRDALSKFKRIDGIGGITLFQNRVVGSGRTLSLDSEISAKVETSGQVSYSVESSGGGSRPTLTRVVLGAAVAGPLGAVVGGVAQKKKKIKSTTVQHDDRTLRIIISSDEGIIDANINPALESRAREFARNVLNAKTDYPKLKKELEKEKKRLDKEIEDLRTNSPIDKKEKELEALLSEMSDDDRRTLKKIEKETKLYFFVSILSLVLFWFPIGPTILSILSVIESKKNQKYGLYEKRIKLTKRLGIIGSILSVITFLAIVLYNPNKNFNINGQKVELVCKNNVCTSLDNYGDKNATRLLSEIGVRKIDKIERSTNSVIANVYENETSTDGIKILIQYANSNFSKVTKIVSSEADSIVYYSSDETLQTVPFPSLAKVAEAKAKAEEEKRKAAEEEAKRQAAEEARLKAEREAKAAEDARYPSEVGTREVCDQAFHKMYPYRGSKVHSILGVHVIGRSGTNKMVYKVDVTVQNAFGAEYGAVMECVVSRDAGSNIIRVDSLILY